MKKQGILLALLMSYTTICAQDYTLKMDEDEGVYRFSAKINGARMRFIFDSGASCISLSRAMANYLLDNNYVLASDFYGTDTAIVADGRRVAGEVLYLSDVEIAGYHLKDVRASVIDGEDAELLFGQSGIQQLGKITLLGNLLTFKGVSDESKSSERLLRNALRAMHEKDYAAAVQFWKTIETIKPLTDENRFYYAWSLTEHGDSTQALLVAQKIIDPKVLNSNDKAIYSLLAELHLVQNHYEEAVRMFFLAATHPTANTDLTHIAYFYSQMGFVCSTYLKRPDEASAYYTLALKTLAEKENLSLDALANQLQNGTFVSLNEMKPDDLYHLYVARLFLLYKTELLSDKQLSEMLCAMRTFSSYVEHIVQSNQLMCE